MTDIVTGQVVETREPHLFREEWGVQYQVGDWSTVVMYPSKGEADWRQDYATQRNIRARLIRIPAEGEVVGPSETDAYTAAHKYAEPIGRAGTWKAIELEAIDGFYRGAMWMQRRLQGGASDART